MGRQKGQGQGGGMVALAKQARKAQREIKRIQKDLTRETLEVTADDGTITVVVTGDQRIKSITIQSNVVDPNNVTLLQDRITKAVNQALEQSKVMAAERLQAATGGLDMSSLGLE